MTDSAKPMKKQNPIYSGGRNLNAVWKSPHLTRNQRLIMLWLANHMKVRGNFTDAWYAPASAIGAECDMSERTVRGELKALDEAGYITRRVRYNEAGQAPTEYRFTRKIFDEYREYRKAAKAAKAAAEAEAAKAAGTDQAEPAQVAEVAAESATTPPPEAPKPEVLNSVAAKNVEVAEKSVEVAAESAAEYPLEFPLELPLNYTPPSGAPKNGSGSEDMLAAKRAERQRRQDRAEAQRLIVSLLRFNSPWFVPLDAVRSSVDVWLERYGLDALRKLRAEMETRFGLGQLKWLPGSLESTLKVIAGLETEWKIDDVAESMVRAMTARAR